MTPFVASNNSNPRRRITKVEQALLQQSSSPASGSNSSSGDLQIDHDYRSYLQRVLFDEERILQLERQSRWRQQHVHLQQQREEEMSFDYNNDIDSLTYSVSVNGSTASLVGSRSDGSSAMDKIKMNLMSRVQDDDEVVSTMEAELDDTVVSGCTRLTTQSDALTAKVASPWCSFMGAIVDRGEEAKCKTREAFVGDLVLPLCIRSRPGKKDDMSAITRNTAESIESDLSELTDHIKLIMAYSAKRDTDTRPTHVKKRTSSTKTLTEKLEAMNRSTCHKIDTVLEVDAGMNKGRNEAARQHQGKVGSESSSWQGFWKGDAIWSSDQSTECNCEAHRSSNPSQYISDNDRDIATSRFSSFTDKVKATATETIQPEVDVTNQDSRQADINKAYAQAQQGKACARSSFWKDDGVWSSDHSTIFGSLHSTHDLRPRINEYDEAIASSPYLFFGKKNILEEEAESSSCWKAAIDVSSGNTYYYHSKTRETSWSIPSDYSKARPHERGAFPEQMEDKVDSRDSVDADVLASRKKMNEERDEHRISRTNKRRQQHHPVTVTQTPDQEEKTLARRQRFSLFRTVDTSHESTCSHDECDGITRFSC